MVSWESNQVTWTCLLDLDTGFNMDKGFNIDTSISDRFLVNNWTVYRQTQLNMDSA